MILTRLQLKPSGCIRIGLFLGFLLLFGCNPNKLDVDVSDIDVKPLSQLRLEDDLFGLNSGNLDQETARIKAKYGVYYEHYLMNFLARKGTADTGYRQSVLSFIKDKDVRGAYLQVKKLYPNSVIEEMLPGLDKMVKRFKFHFPERKTPTRLITCTSGWNYAFAYLDSAFVLSLDMYLGDTSMYYTMLRYPQYQARKMNSHYLLPDIARGWILTEFDKQEPENTLLSHCVFYGKLYYAVNALLPETNDSLLIGYTGKQMTYCRDFEKNLWGYFAEKNRLYENDLNIIRELTSEGPFSGAISKECPPRIAMWVGWQIVKSYMKNNETLTLKDLMQETNAQKILSKSKYRP